MKQVIVVKYHPVDTEYEDVSPQLVELISNGWVIENASVVAKVIIYILSHEET